MPRRNPGRAAIEDTHRHKLRRAVEDLFRDAWMVWEAALATRLLPADAGIAAQADRLVPGRRKMAQLARAAALLAGAGITAEERDLLWQRARGVPLKHIAHDRGVSISHLSELHEAALKAVCKHAIASRSVYSTGN